MGAVLLCPKIPKTKYRKGANLLWLNQEQKKSQAMMNKSPHYKKAWRGTGQAETGRKGRARETPTQTWRNSRKADTRNGRPHNRAVYSTPKQDHRKPLWA